MIHDSRKKIRVGVFGVGSLGQHHARIYSSLENAELIGVYDVDKDRAIQIAQAHGTKPFESFDELAARVEAASVAVPTDHHFDVASKLMDRNIHLLVEKPIAVTTSEAEKMVALARQKEIILQVGHIERFNPVMKFLEHNLSAPRFIEAIRLAPYPPPRETGMPRGTEVSVILDLMIHDLDIILHLVRSPVKEIHAVGVPVLSPTEDIANVRLLFESGCVANITASRISQERMRKIRVFQQDTYVSLDYMNQTGQLCRKVGKGIEAMTVPIEKGEPLARELDSFLKCVLTRGTPIVTGIHASEALKLAVMIRHQMTESPS
ncbi:MAG: Gfo/Idh/MocA family oxidoreductase [Kiritimatiellae bacterium]|nr:Gfo/Idh/MocA family oxidoreductase [Kiritimatiellia bacterium]